MRRFLLPGLVILVCAVGAAAQAPPQGGRGAAGGGAGGGAGGRGTAPLGGFVRDQQTAPTGTAVIRGRILAVDTGSPIRRAQVRATSGAGRGRLTTTDSEGRFEFRDLPAGRWDLSASKAGFVTLRYGQRRPFEAGRPIELADRQVVDRADFGLPRGGAITGHVFDEFGDPIANARVQVMRYQTVQGVRRLAPAGGGDQSDDTGAFRIFGLMPGDYYVSATVRALPIDDPNTNDATSYAPTYFPGTGSISDAQRVTVSLGQEQGNVSFALLPVRTVRVSGSVIDSNGAALTAGMLMLSPADATGGGFGGPFGGNASRVNPDGTFMIPNVAPGSYTLMATSGGPGGPGGGRFAAGPAGFPEIELAMLPITVGGEDLTGVSLVTGKGASVSGTIVAAQSGTQVPANGIQITTQSLQPQPGPGALGRPVRPNEDGTFTITNLFGPRLIRVNGLPQTWMLKAVVIGGVDVTDTAIDFKSTQQYKDAQIILTDKITEVNGKAAGAGTETALDYTVVVFPDDETKWTGPSRYIRSARPDQQGMFKVRAIPPGARYLAVAVDYLEDGEANDPEFLAEMKGKATSFSVGDGETKSISLKMVTR